MNFRNKYAPVPEESEFEMEDYWVWGGLAIEVEDTYHLFASRWPRKNQFPDDYFVESEIVHATAPSPIGPYNFQRVLIGERDSSYWDSNMSHNPTVHKIGDEYVLFYIGSDFSTFRPSTNRLLRRIGYATVTDIEGPWRGSEQPIIDEESNNPAVFIEQDGSVKLLYRDEVLKIKLAVAENFRGSFQVVNDNVWAEAPMEDFYMFKNKGKGTNLKGEIK